MTLSKNHNFYYRCFSLKLCHKRWFSDIYKKEKNNFELEKIEVLKRVKNGRFFKGASLFIFSKNRSFSYRRFSQKFYKENNVFDIVERKE